MFNVQSFNHWRMLALKCGMDVPAKVIASIGLQDLLKDDPTSAAVFVFFDEIRNASKRGSMLRWDMGVGQTVRDRLARGVWQYNKGDYNRLTLDEDWLEPLLEKHPDQGLVVWQRPWIKPVILQKYPVGFRAFVENSKLIGVSNLYPQRPLPDNQSTLKDTNLVRWKTQALIRKFPAHSIYNTDLEDSRLKPDEVNFTVDWMKTEDGLMFISGSGPDLDAKIEGVQLK